MIHDQLPKTTLDGMGGFIQYSTGFNPSNKPVYVACTDDLGHTHVVAEYDMSDGQLPAKPAIDKNELGQCLPNGS